MITLNLYFRLLFVLIALLFSSCKKEKSCESCNNDPSRGKSNKTPIAIAGPDRSITLPTDSISLDGSMSNDPDGKISEWLWIKISGPASYVITSATDSITSVKNLIAGTYQFELKVKDNGNLSATDTIQLVVHPAATINHPPSANAGFDQMITLPINTIMLDGSASSDPDHNINSYTWTKISGPSSFTVSNTIAVQTQVINLVEGVYQFELKVTDAGGLFSKDTMQLKVNSQLQPLPPPPCATNCGKIVFVSDRDGNDEIYSCNADGSNITRLTHDTAMDGYPAWSPDGTRIAFIRNININGVGDLYIMNADGSNLVQRTFSNDVKNPTWSPNGATIAFTDMIDEASNTWISVIKTMELSTGFVTALPNTMGSSVIPYPAWSPDGTKIAFDSDWNAWDFVSDIFTISPGGSGFTLLTKTFFNDHDYWKPSWSPDGMKVSVTIHQMNSMTEHPGSIAIMNADGSGLTVIKTGILMEMWNETKTSWSPGGTRIAYTENKTVKWVAADGSSSGTIVANAWDADWKH